MPRTVLLFTGPFADLPLDDLAARVADWGFAGVELASWGDHLEVQRALGEPGYAEARLDLLARHDLQVPVVAAHRVGQAVADAIIDDRHRGILPDYVWGDGDPEGVRERALEELTATIRAAQRLGAGVVSGFCGSPLWHALFGWPHLSGEAIQAGLNQFAQRVGPLLEICRETGVRFALEVHPGQIAFDLDSAVATLDALGQPEEIGFTFDPSHLHWQGVDPVAFLRRFPERIYHVHIKDAALQLDGSAGILNGYRRPHEPGRGWEFRGPGHGGIDWPAILRALTEIGYAGPLAVEWSDPLIDRDWGAADACQFVRRLDFEPRRPAGESP